MHVDMDAFFASIEQRNNPKLKGKPVIVGGDPNSRGVVSTCSYEARAYGVHSAMPLAQAYRLCPQGIFLRGAPVSYVRASTQIKEIFERFTPLVEMVSIDEAFLDLSGTERLIGAPSEVAQKIKSTIRKEVGITCTVGIGMNKLIAKLASGLEKPDGLTIITPDQIEERLYPLSVDRIWGVGPVTYKKLHKLGIETIGDFARCDAEKLNRMLGNVGEVLSERSRGIDDLPVLDEQSQPEEKSISHAHTLAQDTSDLELIQSMILTLGEKVVIRLQRGNWLAGTVGLILRFADFQTISRQKTLAQPTDDLREICETVRAYVPKKDVATKKVRLVGVRASSLTPNIREGQIELFGGSDNRKKRSLDLSIMELRERFGEVVITHAGTMLFAERTRH